MTDYIVSSINSFMNENFVLNSLCYILISCILLMFAKWLFKKAIKYDMYEEIKKGNITGIVPYCGFLFGNVAILIGAFVGPDSATFLFDLAYYIVYALIGICLMIFSGYITEKAILHKFNNVDEIVRDRNLGTAAVHFGIYVASGLIISACVTGETLATHGKMYGLISSFVYYAMGAVFLILFSKIHDMLTPYSLLKEIEEDNVAVGISFAGHIIAIGIILMRASIGDVGTWQHGIITYFIDLSAIILLLPFIRILLDRIIVKNINIAQEVKGNNIAAGFGEAVVIVGFALLLFFMVDFVNII
ncbi:MAG: DUF350 domain-containing protein [Candidatus Gastranaerophilaceae bacterium]